MSINLLVTSPISEDKYGGPVQVIHDHISYFHSIKDLNFTCLSVVDDLHESTSRLAMFPHTFCQRDRPRSWSYSKDFDNALVDLLSKSDVVHAHMLWDYTTFSSYRGSRNLQKPMILSPHGSVSGTQRVSSLKKKMYKRLFLSSMLRKPPVLHALTENEAEDIRKFGFEGSIEVIPNGVSRDFIVSRPRSSSQIRNSLGLRNQRIALYMGRLWRGKGLIELIDAWGRLVSENEHSEWVLLLAGPDYRGFQHILQKKIDQNRLRDKIKIIGPVYNESKIEVLDTCELFILPSHEEAFSMSILEAAARNKPVIYTTQCNFPELSAVGGGWEVPNNSQALYEILLTVLRHREPILEMYGQKGKSLIERAYTHEIVCEALTTLYSKVVK